MTNPMSPRVAVLMSTYQGETFVVEQIRSILSQLPPDGRLIVRDDGSTDRTLERVRDIRDTRVEVTAGPNLGFAGSFLTLLCGVGDDADVVMLADQDDVWLPGKIERACRALRGFEGEPALYFSRLQLVDRELRPLGETPRWPRGPSFANALCENIATGCTMALNARGVRLVSRYGDVRKIYFHDWWIYLVVSALGKVIMDDEPTILYRQHGANVVGRGQGWRRYRATLAFIRKRSWIHILFQQVENLVDTHGDALDAGQRRMIELYFSPRRVASVIRLLLIPVRRRQFIADEIIFRALLVAEVLSGRGLLPRPSEPALPGQA